MMMFLLTSMLLIFMLLNLFYAASKKGKNEYLNSNPFECGFTSHFYSRHSFSIHYFIVALIFLFLDLEICFLMPMMNEESSSPLIWLYVLFFVSVLLIGLIKEWKEKKLDWEF